MTAITITVRQVLDRKGGKIHTVSPDNSVYEALELMARHEIGAVLVTEGERLLGIFTERDYARKIVLKGLTSRGAKVGELMSANIHTVPPTEQITAVMSTMTKRRFRHVPVVEGGMTIGLISIGDVVKAIMDEQEATIQHLANYIAGDLAT